VPGWFRPLGKVNLMPSCKRILCASFAPWRLCESCFLQRKVGNDPENPELNSARKGFHAKAQRSQRSQRKYWSSQLLSTVAAAAAVLGWFSPLGMINLVPSRKRTLCACFVPWRLCESCFLKRKVGNDPVNPELNSARKGFHAKAQRSQRSQRKYWSSQLLSTVAAAAAVLGWFSPLGTINLVPSRKRTLCACFVPWRLGVRCFLQRHED